MGTISVTNLGKAYEQSPACWSGTVLGDIAKQSAQLQFFQNRALCTKIKNDHSGMKFEMDSTAAVLFGNTRQAVLTHLFEQPESATYLRELARQTGISPGALQQELNQLLKADLVTRRQDGNRVLYAANTEHPVFTELQAIIRKTCGLPAQIKAALLPLAGNISFACIYGSIAKGREHARSDVDLLIIGLLPFEQAIQIMTPVEERLGREISIRLFTPDEFRQRRGAGDYFIRSIFAGERINLIGSIDDA